MALLGGNPSTQGIKLDLKTTTSVFEPGNLSVTCIRVETSNIASPPKPLLIVTPTIQGTYPVLLFLHGFELRNTFYTQLLQLISSHGYIVVAPQVLSQPLFPVNYPPPPIFLFLLLLVSHLIVLNIQLEMIRGWFQVQGELCLSKIVSISILLKKLNGQGGHTNLPYSPCPTI